MVDTHLIILYGDISNEFNGKQQRMIDGGVTCGYREYARNYGDIIYLSPQTTKLEWEHSITKPDDVISFINKHPDSVVWSVKHSPRKDKHILSKISNKKMYYSCNAANTMNNFCDISLVDTEGRVKNKKQVLWFKGKDQDYWKSEGQEKEFDYLLIGLRGDKNEAYFLNNLNKIKEPRRVLWIGGEKHRGSVKCKHEVVYTGVMRQDDVKNNIPKAKVGVLFTELTIEGFPQSFLEMTVCGVPVVYNINAPRNKFYFHKNNCLLSTKTDLINNAEKLLKSFDTIKCRETAIANYSLDKSYERLLSCIK